MKIYYITEEKWNRFEDDYEFVGLIYATLNENRARDMLSTFRNISQDSNFELEIIELDDSNDFVNKELVEDKRVYAYLHKEN